MLSEKTTKGPEVIVLPRVLSIVTCYLGVLLYRFFRDSDI